MSANPKFQRCEEEGARTVLVLEEGDIFLSNHVLIGKRLTEHGDQPDQIYLVRTALDRWNVWPMKYDERHLPGEERTEFNNAIA